MLSLSEDWDSSHGQKGRFWLTKKKQEQNKTKKQFSTAFILSMGLFSLSKDNMQLQKDFLFNTLRLFIISFVSRSQNEKIQMSHDP